MYRENSSANKILSAGTGDNTAVPGQSLALDAVSGDIISVLAGYRLEQFASSTVDLFAPVLDTAIDSMVLAQEEFPFVDCKRCR